MFPYIYAMHHMNASVWDFNLKCVTAVFAFQQNMLESGCLLWGVEIKKQMLTVQKKVGNVIYIGR